MLYPYRCDNGHEHDAFVALDDRNQPRQCPECGETATRRLTADFGFKMHPDGLLNTRNNPNDGVHSFLGKHRRTKYGHGQSTPTRVGTR